MNKNNAKAWFENLSKDDQEFVLVELHWAGSPVQWVKMCEEQKAHIGVFFDNYSEVVA